MTAGFGWGYLMSDVHVPVVRWRQLQKVANCTVPRAVEAIVKNGVQGKEIAAAAKYVGVKALSAHAVGKIIKLTHVTHSTAASFLKAYNQFANQNTERKLPVFNETEIVGAYFGIPKLNDYVVSAKFADLYDFSSACGMASQTIEHAIGSPENGPGRVTGAIAWTIYKTLKPILLKNGIPLPPLREFASSETAPSKKYGETSIQNAPFELNELLLPLPSGADLPPEW